MNRDKFDAAAVAAHATTYRAAEGLTQRQLADQLNTTRGVIGALEGGKIRSARVAQRVLDLVVVNVDGVI